MERERARIWYRAGARLERLRQRALRAESEEVRINAIDQANALFETLERSGLVSRGERIGLGRDWVQAFARDRLPVLFRQKDATKVDRLGKFLVPGAGCGARDRMAH